MADFAALLAVQDLDNQMDALVNRLQRLPERVAVTEAVGAAKAIAKQAVAARAASAQAAAEVERLELEGHARDAKKARLQQQLKTVIASRAAEALMHEIAILDEERSAADDRELELLDVIELNDSAAAEAESQRVLAEIAASDAAANLARAEADGAAERDALTAQRVVASTGVSDAVRSRYESRRSSFKGVAIARLVASHCSACHLDLSRTFIDQLRHHTGDDPMECEQCGRWLVA